MHSITLTTSEGNWRLFVARKADESFQRFSERIWGRDSYTCQFCGFQAKQYQEVVNLIS